MDNLLLEYLPILVFLGIALGLGLVLLLAAAVIAIRNPDPKKFLPTNVVLMPLMMLG